MATISCSATRASEEPERNVNRIESEWVLVWRRPIRIYRLETDAWAVINVQLRFQRTDNGCTRARSLCSRPLRSKSHSFQIITSTDTDCRCRQRILFAQNRSLISAPPPCVSQSAALYFPANINSPFRFPNNGGTRAPAQPTNFQRRSLRANTCD